jgi:EpsD family peptidyl-prolyl cis-trans isomerase
MNPSLHKSIAISLFGAALALGLAACGKKDDKQAATQVAVKVGTEEISVHQINQQLSRATPAGAAPEVVQAKGREVLEKLIDQQLAINQAMEAKMNRAPEVVTQIEASRRDILARAYLQKVVASVPKPTAEETRKYYTGHPELFAERRIFNFQEIVVPIAPGLADEMRGLVQGGKPITDVAAWLKGRNIKFAANSATRPAEQLPLELLARVQPLKDGQSLLVQSPQALTLLRIAGSQSAPVTEAAALPRIEQFLTNQRAGEAVAANIKQLRKDTPITYMGEFAKPQAAASAPAAPPTAAASAAVDPARLAIEKGIAGLK